MNGPDLEAAVRPVAEFYDGVVLSQNTVLRAWLRSRELPAHGPAWTVAKAAVDAGKTFEEAADEALRTVSALRRGPTAPSGPVVVASASPPPVRVATERGQAAASVALDWFPKVFGPGDMVGKGAQRLLGTPNIPMVSVLVRETAQNSWDARRAGSSVRFTINLRRVTQDERGVLRDRIFTGDAPILKLEAALSKPELWCIEISDRGTRGLGGPVRNDLETAAAEATDFIDLIFNLGAPRDVKLGAGTYGFGKSIAYRASRCGVVLFWSRSREGSRVEDRLIGSAFGDSFVKDGLNHTGRHWWGVNVEGGRRVEPLIGEPAAALAGSVFTQGFGRNETGTSMLILDPDLGFSTRDEDARAIAEAVAWNLWPKLMDPGPGRSQMTIEVLHDGSPVIISTPEDDPTFAGYAECLEMVRAVQAGRSHAPNFFTQVVPIEHGTKRKVLGHLAFCRYPSKRRTGVETVAAYEGPSCHVAWMRHDAELVVKYDAKQRLESDTFQWCAVFKPVAEADNSFAAAEPPAHDDWVVAGVDDKSMQSDVRVALTKIKSAVQDFLSPHQAVAAPTKSGRSVAAVADSLAGLIGGVPGSATTARSPRGSLGSKAQAKPRADLVSQWRSPASDGRQLTAVRVAIAGSSAAEVSAMVGVAVEGSIDRDDKLASIKGWVQGSVNQPDLRSELADDPQVLLPKQSMWVVIEHDAGLAIDLSVAAEVAK